MDQRPYWSYLTLTVENSPFYYQQQKPVHNSQTNEAIQPLRANYQHVSSQCTAMFESPFFKKTKTKTKKRHGPQQKTFLKKHTVKNKSTRGLIRMLHGTFVFVYTLYFSTLNVMVEYTAININNLILNRLYYINFIEPFCFIGGIPSFQPNNLHILFVYI